MIKKKLFVFSIVFFSITFNSFSIEPDIFVQSTVNRASQTLSKDISKKEKMLELQKLAKDTVDIKGIGFYTLGKYRKESAQVSIAGYPNLYIFFDESNFSLREEALHPRLSNEALR